MHLLLRYESKSEVIEYKAAADVTLPKKRELDEGEEEEQPKPKKIKVGRYLNKNRSLILSWPFFNDDKIHARHMRHKVRLRSRTLSQVLW